jgi:hypothetical protein
VSLDFEHNVRPAPVITEEVTASIEEMIQKRIIEVKYYPVLTLFGIYYNVQCCYLQFYTRVENIYMDGIIENFCTKLGVIVEYAPYYWKIGGKFPLITKTMAAPQGSEQNPTLDTCLL